MASECYTCEEIEAGEEEQEVDRCTNPQRPCGHHCNCIWVHEHCHFCDGEFDESGENFVIPLQSDLV